METIKIDINDFKIAFTNERNRMLNILEDAVLRIENQGKAIENYEGRLVEITDASIVNGLISCLAQKGLEIIDKTTGKKQVMLGYYFKMLTSHFRIFEDFEFYNIALIIRYLLEATTGIILNFKNLDSHFAYLDNKEFKSSLKEWNAGITKKIRETLGPEYSKIYATLSRYIHPINGPLFGADPEVVARRNFFTIEAAIKIYIKATKEILKICNYELQVDFENYLLETLKNTLESCI